MSGKITSRVALIMALLIPVALLYWSITYRISLIDQSALQVKNMNTLEGDVIRAKSEWSEKVARETRKQWDNERSRLLGSYESLSAWLESINQRSRSIGINMRYTIGELKPADEKIPGVSIVPVEMTFSFFPNQGRRNTDGYLIFMGFLKDIMEQDLVLDLMKINIFGDGSMAHEMKVVVDTWVNFGESPLVGSLTSSFGALRLENIDFVILLRPVKRA